MVMTDVLMKMANYYAKFAQKTEEIAPVDPAKQVEMNKFALALDKQARILADAVVAGIQAGTSRPEARSYSDGLRDLAIQYRTELDANNATNLPDYHQQMMQMYNILADSYVGADYEPMKKIKEALVYLAPNNL